MNKPVNAFHNCLILKVKMVFDKKISSFFLSSF